LAAEHPIATVGCAGIPIVAIARLAAPARALQAEVLKCADVAIITRNQVVDKETPDGGIAAIVSANVAVVADQRRTPQTESARTAIVGRAAVPIVARAGIVLVLATGSENANVIRTGVAVIALGIGNAR